MSQSAKPSVPQAQTATSARRGKAAAAGADALGHAQAALARAGFRDATLVLRWAEIVGDAVASTARPVKCQHGPEGSVLTLKCESGAMVFLQHQTRSLLSTLNAYAGAERIVRIRLVAGKLNTRPAPARHCAPALDSGAPASLPDALERLSRLRRQMPRR